MTTDAPRTVEQYLARLRDALHGADPALIQDALYDAEEHLRAELAQHPGDGEAEVLARIVTSYGAPDEVADAYRANEITVQAALRIPRPQPRRTAIGRFFGVYADARSYLALAYMLLAMFTGIVYFTFATTGLAMTVGFAVLIIGIPFFLLFIGATRGISLFEGRIVEALLGTRMPRRPLFADRQRPWLQRIVDMLKDLRTWGTVLYLLMMLPLGIFYFVFAVVGLSVSLGMIAAPVAILLGYAGVLTIDEFTISPQPDPWLLPLVAILGIVLLTITLHLVRGIGYLHGQLAKTLLVSSTRQD
jgi:uncharacterized membrane protein